MGEIFSNICGRNFGICFQIRYLGCVVRAWLYCVLLTYLLTYLLINLLINLLTYLLHGAESFLRS
jgi:hypothetical protein